jgi:hypothetical protein
MKKEKEQEEILKKIEYDNKNKQEELLLISK